MTRSQAIRFRPEAVVFGILLVSAALATPAPPAATISRHDVTVHLDVPAHRLEATDTVSLGASPEGAWRFLLHSALEISVVRTPEGEVLEWERADGWDPRHFWERPPYGELARFEAVREVSVQPPQDGWRTSGPRIVVEYSGIIADSLHSPERAYGRSFETTSGRIVDQGAYLHGGTFWVPWSGDELFEFHLTVDGPGEWRVVSQGTLVTDEPRAGRRHTVWDSSRLPTEGIYLIAGPYELRETIHTLGDRNVRLMSYCYANTSSDITDRYLDATGPYLDQFSELFGAYPYSKFALVENYWQTGYGMPSFTFLGDRVIRLPFILHTSYPHEILHNWWGNGVYVQWEQGNWCEGLTTYCADYLAKEREGAMAARDYRRSTLLKYRDFAAAGGKDFPLVQFRERESASSQAVGYGKTFMVFHMLRQHLGDDVFFAGLRQLYEEQLFRRSAWDDVQEAFESVSAARLAPWFDQWIRSAGAVELKLEGVIEEPTPGGARITGKIVQAGPAFDIRVPVVVEGVAGETVTSTVASIGSETEFGIAVDFAPRVIRADPGFDLFRLLHAEEVAPALSGVLGAKQVRIVLGEELAGGMGEAMRSLAEEWAQDSTVVFLDERDAPVSDSYAGGTWFFGEGRAAGKFRSRDLPGSELPGDPGTLVAAGRLEGDPDRPAALFLPESAEVVPSIARKIPHYSKYSFLVFAGERNVSKGSWSAGESPLSVKLRGS